MPALADELETSGIVASTVRPQMAVYCLSKAYVLSLDEAIAYELRDRGITVIALCPVPRQRNLPRKLNLRQRG